MYAAFVKVLENSDVHLLCQALLSDVHRLRDELEEERNVRDRTMEQIFGDLDT